MPFETKISRARFVVGPFSSEQMAAIGNAALDSISSRIKRGINVNDAPAKPLKPGRNGRRGYPDYKAARGLNPFRDWVWRGKTMRSLKVKAANENRVVLGFIDSASDTIAHINNLRERMFGVSPSDQQAIRAAVSATVKQQRVVRVVKAA